MQETFFTQIVGARRVEVLKSYDQAYAREAFQAMSRPALQHLWRSLKPEDIYASEDLPRLDVLDGEAEAFLWDELLEQARESGNQLSFFVVNESLEQKTETLYVSPDWPSAEAFATTRLNEVGTKR